MLTPDAAELQDRLDRIVTLLLVVSDFQGQCCARGRVNAGRVIRIALGESGRVLDGAVVDDAASVPVQLEIGAGGPEPEEPDVAVAPC